MLCRVYQAVCFACHLQEASPSKLFLTRWALTHAKGLLKRDVPQDIFALANKRATCNSSQYDLAPSDFFFAAIIALVERGVLSGNIARYYKRSTIPAENWEANALQLAMQVGLCTNRGHFKARLAHLIKLLECDQSIASESTRIQVPTNVPSVIENPTGDTTAARQDGCIRHSIAV